MMPEGTCDRAMDLAFLLDGSEALTEDEFQATKEFILGVVERFRMGSAHTRATVLLYHSGVKTYDLQVDNCILYMCETGKCVFFHKYEVLHDALCGIIDQTNLAHKHAETGNYNNN